METPKTLSMDAVLARARELRPDYEKLVRNIPFERLGVLYSEGLFLWAAASDPAPARIVESGRARGQSTLLLATCFPDTEIVSFEIDPHGPDAEAAAKRLAGFSNVDLRFGDARVELPRHVRPGDVVVIDGPKGYRGLKLAAKVLQRCRPRLLFMHDSHVGSEERTFLEATCPDALYSDHPEFEREHADLDDRCYAGADDGSAIGWRPHRYKDVDQPSYGPTYAVVAHDPAHPWGRVRLRAGVESMTYRLRRSARKRLGPGSGA